MQESKTTVVLRNSLRLHRNELLSEGHKILLYLDDAHLRDHPFTGLVQTQTQFNQVKERKFKSFETLLLKKGYDVKIIKSTGSISSPNIQADLPDGAYEQDDLRNFEVEYCLDHNYLLKRSEVLNSFTARMPFSKFRKLFEAKAYSFQRSETKPQVQTEALNYLRNYFSNKYASTYFETRNQLLGDNFSTGFSKYLNLGELHPLDILESLAFYEKEHGQNKSTSWIRFELLWREYFHFLYLKHQNDFFNFGGLSSYDTKALTPISVREYLDSFHNPLIIAMNKELMDFGTLSNRSRQIYASFLVHNTELDWRYGAWFFQIFLKDFDLSSNWGNWLYMAGVGTDSRGPRFFKITKQMQQYDPELQYLQYFGELSESIWKEIDNT